MIHRIAKLLFLLGLFRVASAILLEGPESEELPAGRAGFAQPLGGGDELRDLLRLFLRIHFFGDESPAEWPWVWSHARVIGTTRRVA